MSFVATGFVWGPHDSLAPTQPPIRYEATEAARVAANASLMQQQTNLALSMSCLEPLGSPLSATRRGEKVSAFADADPTSGQSSFRDATSRSGGSPGRYRRGGDQRASKHSGGGAPSDPYYESTDFLSDQAAAAHQQWYSDKRGMAKMYVLEVTERLTLLELEERKAEGLRLAYLQDPLSTSAATTVLTDEQEMLLQSLRLRMSTCSNEVEEGLENWAYSTDPLTNKRTKRPVAEIRRLRKDMELDHQAQQVEARMASLQAAKRRRHRQQLKPCHQAQLGSDGGAEDLVKDWFEA